jgi:hypothetical protein
MKTLQVIALLSFVFAFTAKVNAQTVVTRDIQMPSNFWIDCVNESASGMVTVQFLTYIYLKYLLYQCKG